MCFADEMVRQLSVRLFAIALGDFMVRAIANGS